MKKQMLLAISLGTLSLSYLGFSYYREAQLYYMSVEDCDRYRDTNRVRFTRCWRNKRNATYTLRKNYDYISR